MRKSRITLAAFLLLLAALAPQAFPAATHTSTPDELEEEHSLSTEYATPHTPWARPYAGGKVRVLFFINQRGDGGTLVREAVELKQRFDIEAEAVFWARIVDTTIEGWHGGPAGEARMKRLLGQPWDCFVFLGITPDKMPVEEQYHMLEAVTKGAGLVLVGEDDKRVLKTTNRAELPPFLTSGVPLTGLPFAQNGVLARTAREKWSDADAAAKLLSAHTVKAGRAIRLPQRPVIEYRPGWETEYDYWQSLLGRAILWAAGRAPQTALSVSARAGRVDRAALPAGEEVAVRWSGAPTGAPLTLKLALRGADGSRWPLPSQQVTAAEGQATPALPVLPAGWYTVDAILAGARGTVAWASGAFEVTSTRTVQEIALEKDWSEPGGEMRGTVSLAGAAPLPQERVRVDLVDRHDRVLMRREGPAPGGRMAFTFPVAEWLPMLVRVQATLLTGEATAASSTAWFSVTKRNRGHFNFLMWDYPGGTLGPYGEESLARLGVSLQLTQGAPPRHVRAFDVAWVPYTTRIMAPHDPKGVMQPCCWNDEDAIRKYVEDIVSKRQPDREGGVFVYSLGDETVTRGSCTHPACLAAYRDYLRGEYGTIQALNASWGSNYASFDQVALDPPDDNDGNAAKAAGNTPRWFDRQAFQCRNFVKLCGRFVAEFRKLDPQARVGFEGAGRFDTGDDYDAIVRNNGFWSPYPGLGDEIIRSIAPRDFPRANWIGYTKDADSLLSKYWRVVTRGGDAVWWWRWDGIGRFHGFLAPNLAPFAATADLVRDTQVLRDGLGDLLLQSEMQDDGVAFLYSMPSAYASRAGQGPGYGTYSSAHEAWSRNVRELRLQYRYVTDAMLRRGEVKPSQYKAIVLSRAEAIGPKDAAALRSFVEQGGRLIADLRPGLYDDHCKPLQQGLLDDVFGIRHGADAAPVQGEADLGGLRLPAVTVDPAVSLAGGTAGGHCGQTPVAISHSFGKGSAVLLNFAINAFPGLWLPETPRPADAFLEGLFAPAGVRPTITVAGADGARERNLEVIRWRNGDSTLVALFRESGQPSTATISLPGPAYVYDLRDRIDRGQVRSVTLPIRPGRATFLAVTPAAAAPAALSLQPGAAAARGSVATLKLAGPAPASARVVLVTARQPDGSPADWLRRVVVVPPAGAEVPIAVAYNDPAGKWSIEATELYTNKRTTVDLTVR